MSTPPKENFRSSNHHNSSHNKKPVHKNFGPNSVIESHGPSGKNRGTMQQLIDRYLTLGKEAIREDDAVLAEALFQHADHYRRLLSSVRKSDPSPDNETVVSSQSTAALPETTHLPLPPKSPSSDTSA